MILSILGVLVFVAYIVVLVVNIQNGNGCGGDCQQGRYPCNCKDRK